METYHPPKEEKPQIDNSGLPNQKGITEQWVREKIDNLIPLIQKKWPNIAIQTIEAAKGSLDDLVGVISNHTETSSTSIKNQLFEIFDSIQDNNWEIADKIQPIETQLEDLLDELNNTLRPKIENPIKKKPILSVAIAAGIGLLIGTFINSGKK